MPLGNIPPLSFSIKLKKCSSLPSDDSNNPHPELSQESKQSDDREEEKKEPVFNGSEPTIAQNTVYKNTMRVRSRSASVVEESQTAPPLHVISNFGHTKKSNLKRKVK